MKELDRSIMEIRDKYFKLDEKSRKEFLALFEKLNRFLSTKPSDKEMRSIRVLIQKKLSAETSRKSSAYAPIWYDMPFPQQLRYVRSFIVHNRPVDNRKLLDFGEMLWKKITETYADDAPTMYNLLSYVLPLKDDVALADIRSSDNIIQYFYQIYQKKSDAEKVIIIRNLVPLLAPRFEQRQY